MAKSNNRGHNADLHVIEMARERPFAAAAAAAGAAAAGLFLWSKRTQISEQLGHLSDQFGEWRETVRSEPAVELPEAGNRPTRSRRGRVQPTPIQ